jgi:hypothetical protein
MYVLVPLRTFVVCLGTLGMLTCDTRQMQIVSASRWHQRHQLSVENDDRWQRPLVQAETSLDTSGL